MSDEIKPFRDKSGIPWCQESCPSLEVGEPGVEGKCLPENKYMVLEEDVCPLAVREMALRLEMFQQWALVKLSIQDENGADGTDETLDHWGLTQADLEEAIKKEEAANGR